MEKIMKVGIIAAEEKEIISVKKLMQNIVEHTIYNLNFYEGKIEKVDCVVTKCGVRKGK